MESVCHPKIGLDVPILTLSIQNQVNQFCVQINPHIKFGAPMTFNLRVRYRERVFGPSVWNTVKKSTAWKNKIEE